MLPYVSIIVPVYNGEEYLNDCICSLVEQILNDIEIVIVDDGSTDSTPDILKYFADKYKDKIKVLTKSNGGQGSARNLALNYCRGEYIGYIDADDSVSNDMFQTMYKEAKNKDLDLVTCDWYIVENKKKKLNKFGAYSSAKEMFKGVSVVPWNKLIKREVLVNSGAIFPEGYIYEDTAWFIELLPFINSVGHIDKPFINHRIWSGSTMGAKQNSRAAQIFPVMNHIVDFYKARGFYEQYKYYVEFFYVRVLFCSSLQRIAKISDKSLKRNLCRKTLAEVKNKFPKYKNNPYLKGGIGLYIKSMNKFTIKLYASVFKLL